MNEYPYLLYVKPKRLYYELETLREVNAHRKVNCIFYKLCLSHAAYFFWDSFTCKFCNLFYPDPHRDEEQDYSRCIRLINDLEKPPRLKLKVKKMKGKFYVKGRRYKFNKSKSKPYGPYTLKCKLNK